jgi:hypothetical protein
MIVSDCQRGCGCATRFDLVAPGVAPLQQFVAVPAPASITLMLTAVLCRGAYIMTVCSCVSHATQAHCPLEFSKLSSVLRPRHLDGKGHHQPT